MPSLPSQPPSPERVQQTSPLQSRMASVQDNVRSLLRASIYSLKPAAASPSQTPKLRIPIPSLSERFRSQPRETTTNPTATTRHSSDTSGLYAAPTPTHENAPVAIPIPPAPAYTTRIVTPNDGYAEDHEEQRDDHSLTGLVQERSQKRHKKAWKRRRGGRSSRHNHASRRRDPKARALGQALILSGILLMAVLSLYISLALSGRVLGIQGHVLFILVILAITIFFAHALVRLCLLRSSHSRRSRRHHHHRNAPERIPSMTGPEGFRPDTPIRVHLQRDEELGPASEFDTSPEIPSPETPADNSTFEGLLQQKTSTRIEGPPPAYGLWRSSVRADPNLLHWQLNPSPHPPSPNPTNLNISLSSARSSPVLPHPQPSTPFVAAATGARSPLPPHHPGFSDGAGSGASDATPVPRPPSYVSEDGVAYVVDALGRRPEMVQRG